MEKQYIAIDLKSFYASVECKDRQLDPLKTNLVVADVSRTEKTICLAVSPSLKAYGISGRARLFEVVASVKKINAERLKAAPGHTFSGASYDAEELAKNPSLALDYIAAPPRMQRYIETSTKIYQVYLKYVAPEDIHVYSIDEVFMDVTHYLMANHMTAREMAACMIADVFETTGITATAGIGTNLYLAKIAMDIMAKHVDPDANGVRIAYLDEMSYRRELWNHRPLTDFWRVGRGIAKRLEEHGIMTMGDIARCSIGADNVYYNEELLYKLFGINAELLIDHAWGYEPCTIAAIKAYRPANNSVGTGQVLQYPYTFEKARLIVKEMMDLLSLDLVARQLVTNQLNLVINYDIDNLKDPVRMASYKGEIVSDYYGRQAPKPVHATKHLMHYTSSTKELIDGIVALYEQIVDPNLLVRRINITAMNVILESQNREQNAYEQLDLFTDYEALQKQREQEEMEQQKEKQVQHALIDIKKKFGKNAVLKGMNLEEGAMTKTRNDQIGGHKA